VKTETWGDPTWSFQNEKYAVQTEEVRNANASRKYWLVFLNLGITPIFLILLFFIK